MLSVCRDLLLRQALAPGVAGAGASMGLLERAAAGLTASGTHLPVPLHTEIQTVGLCYSPLSGLWHRPGWRWLCPGPCGGQGLSSGAEHGRAPE